VSDGDNTTVLGIRINLDASQTQAGADEASQQLARIKNDLGGIERAFGTLDATQQRYVVNQYKQATAATGNAQAVKTLEMALLGFNAEQIRAAEGLGKFTEGAKSAGKAHESMAGDIFKGTLATEYASKAISKVVDLYIDVRRRVEEAQQTEIALAGVLEVTGRAWQGAGQEIERTAKAMQAATRFDDDGVRRAGAVIATFANVSTQQFGRIIRAAGDLAVIFGGDLKSNSELLARALNEPDQALGALTRRGIQFDEGVRRQIKSMVAMNDVAGAQEVILAAVEGRVGGVAERAYVGLNRQLEGTKKAWDDLLKAMGNKIFDAQATEAGYFERVLLGIQNTIENIDLAKLTKIILLASPGTGLLMVQEMNKLGAKAPAPTRAPTFREMEIESSEEWYAEQQRKTAALIQAAARGEATLDQILSETRTKAQKFADEEKKLMAAAEAMVAAAMGDPAKIARINADVARAYDGLVAKYAEKTKAMKDSSADWAKATRDHAVAEAKAAYDIEKATLDQLAKALDDVHKRGLVSEQAYWNQKAQYAEAGIAAERSNIKAAIAAEVAEQDDLVRARAKTKLSAEQLEKINLQLAASDTKLVALNAQLAVNTLKAGEGARIRAQGEEAIFAALRRRTEEVMRAIDPDQQALDTLKRQNEEYGLSAEQIARLNVLRVQEQLALVQSRLDTEGYTEALDDQRRVLEARIRLGRQMVTEVSRNESLKAQTESIRRETEEIRSMWQTTEQVAKQMWDAIVDRTGNAAQRMKDLLKRLLFDWLWDAFAKKQVLQLFISATGISATQANAAGLLTQGGGLGGLMNNAGNWLTSYINGGSSAAAVGAATGSVFPGESAMQGVSYATGSGATWMTSIANNLSTVAGGVSKLWNWATGAGGGFAESGVFAGESAMQGASYASSGAGGALGGMLASAGWGALIGGILGPMISKDERAGTAGTIGGAAGGVIGGVAAGAMTGAAAGSVVPVIGTIIGAVIGAAIGALSTGDGPAQRTARFGVGGTPGSYTYQGSSKFGSFGIERGSDSWFSDSEMGETLTGWMKSIELLDNAIAKNLSAAQVTQIQGALTGTGGAYGFGMEHTEIPGGTFGLIVRERYTAVFNVLDATMGKLIQNFEGTNEDLLKLIADLATVHFTLEQQHSAIRALVGEDVTFDKLQGLKAEGESYAETLQRVLEVYTVTNLTAQLMGKTVGDAFGGMGLASLQMRQQLVEAAGGVQQLAQLQQSYLANYFSAGERLAMVTQDVQKGFAALGIEMPTTKDELRAIISGLDLTTTEGQRLYAELLKLAPGFAQIADAAAADAAAAIALAQTSSIVALTLHTTTAALFGLGEAGEEAEQALADAAGGVQNLAQLTAGYQNSFLSAQERYGINVADLQGRFTELGISMPKTKDEFRAIIDHLDLTTDSGRKMYVALLQLAPQFAAVADQALADAAAAVQLAQVSAIVALTLGKTTEQVFGVGAAATMAQEDLADLAGGMSNLASLTAAYQNSFLSAQERYGLNLADLKTHFKDLGVEMPRTKAEFNAIVRGLDLNTEHGRHLYVELLRLAPQFASVAEQAEQMRLATQAVLDGLDEYVRFNPAEALQQAMDPMNASLVTAWQRQGETVRGLINVYDGSVEAQQRLGEAVKQRYDLEKQLINQVADALKSVTGTASDAIRSMTLQTLDNPGKYLYYDAEIVRLRATLNAATDPQEIARLQQTITGDITAAFNLLSPEEQRAKLAEFNARVETIRNEAETRLHVVQGTIEAQHTSLPTSIQTAIENAMKKVAEDMLAAAGGMGTAATEMGKAAKDMTGAANTFVGGAKDIDGAAKTPKVISVGINVQDDRISTEVNG
jgi:hypothetical protein